MMRIRLNRELHRPFRGSRCAYNGSHVGNSYRVLDWCFNCYIYLGFRPVRDLQ